MPPSYAGSRSAGTPSWARGAVVTRSVPDHALVEGVPARVVGWMSRLGHKLEFDEAGRAVCPESGRSYRKVNECVYEEDI